MKHDKSYKIEKENFTLKGFEPRNRRTTIQRNPLLLLYYCNFYYVGILYCIVFIYSAFTFYS